MRATDFRARAREALRGHWGAAIGVSVVAVLLGGMGVLLDFQMVEDMGGVLGEGLIGYGLAAERALRSTLDVMKTVAILSTLLAFLVGGMMAMGVAAFNLKLHDRQEARFTDVFSHCHRFGAGFCMVGLKYIFIRLWSLLFVIPGYIAVYRYAMMPYLMAEFPDLGALDAMRESKRLMKGNKWRLFCLHMSFIGWYFLACLTCGIGLLWLIPYIQSAEAAFYREITQTWREAPRDDYRRMYTGPEF